MTESKTLLPTYLLLENDKKSNNLGPVLRCAAAYGISSVLAIGYSQCSVDGSHGASKHVDLVAFPTVQQAIASIHKDRNLISIVGILGGIPLGRGETGDDGDEDSRRRRRLLHTSALPVKEDPEAGIFRVDATATVLNSPELGGDNQQKSSWPVGTRRCFDESKIHCFAICKSKHGLSSYLARSVDQFVHIPHQSMGGQHYSDHPLLDLPACMSLVLHHYTEWAGYDERTFKGHKFGFEQNVQQREIENRERRRNERLEAKKRQRDETESGDSHALATQLFEIRGSTVDSGDY